MSTGLTRRQCYALPRLVEGAVGGRAGDGYGFLPG